MSSLQLSLVDSADIEATRALLTEALGADVAVSPEAARLTAPLTDTSITPELLIRLRDNGIVVDEITVSKPSLDEVFLTITGHGADPAATSDNESSVA